MINLSLYSLIICVFKNSYNLSAFIPRFSYNSQPKTPFVEIANIPVYFLNTSCDFLFHYPLTGQLKNCLFEFYNKMYVKYIVLKRQ
jgi:hypothetical protein